VEKYSICGFRIAAGKPQAELLSSNIVCKGIAALTGCFERHFLRFRKRRFPFVSSAKGGGRFPALANCVDLALWTCDEVSYSPLRGMPEVRDALSARVQPLPEWVLLTSAARRILGKRDPLLFLRNTTRLRSMVVGRVEDVRRVKSGACSWLRRTGGNRVCRNEC